LTGFASSFSTYPLVPFISKKLAFCPTLLAFLAANLSNKASGYKTS